MVKVIKKLYNIKTGQWVGLTKYHVVGGIVKFGLPPEGKGPLAIVNGVKRVLPPDYKDYMLDPEEHPAIKVLYANKGYKWE